MEGEAIWAKKGKGRVNATYRVNKVIRINGETRNTMGWLRFSDGRWFINNI
jgi:hypothetical protein